MTMQHRLAIEYDVPEPANGDMTGRSACQAPAYCCPGCNMELVTGNSALQHFNGCKALRDMIACGGSSFFTWGAAAGSRQEKLLTDDAQRKEKVKPPLRHWQTHGPVVSVAPAKTDAPIEMESPASIKEKGRKPRLRLNHFRPHRLLDTLIKTLSLDNDAALAETLQVRAPVISKIRHGKLPVGASILIRMHEVSDIPIAKLRVLIPEDTKYIEIMNEVNEQQKPYS